MVDQLSAHDRPPVREVVAPGTAVLALQAADQDVLVVVGEADIATAQQLYDQVLQALPVPPRPVLLELGGLTFCDLRGVDALRDVVRAATAAGVAMTLRGQSAQLQWLLDTAPHRVGPPHRRRPLPDPRHPVTPGCRP